MESLTYNTARRVEKSVIHIRLCKTCSLSYLGEYKIIMTLKTKFNLRILRLFRARCGDAATWGEVGGAVSASGPWATSPFPPDLCPSMCPRSVPPMPQTATTPLTQRGTREVHPSLKDGCWEMAGLALGEASCPGQLSDCLLPWTSSRQFF